MTDFASRCRFLNGGVASANAAYATVQLGWDPMGKLGEAWLRDARDVLAKEGEALGVRAVIAGEPCDGWDAIHAVYGTLPMLAGLISGFVLLLVGVAFRSVLLPLRTAATITVTLIVVYGMAVLVYQDGIFDWAFVDGLHQGAGQEWLVPVLSFPILVGISLDYDVFLLSSVFELRAAGHTTDEAVRMGVYSTGSVITTAGVIMAIAFSGLMFSTMPVPPARAELAIS